MKRIIGIPFEGRAVCRCGKSWLCELDNNYKNEIDYLAWCADCAGHNTRDNSNALNRYPNHLNLEIENGH